jgi:putative transposase
MRVEPRGVGSIVHVIQRGARGLNIVRDRYDRARFSELLFYLNDSFSDPNWLKATKECAPFERPDYWPDRDPLVRILAWTLLPNHFHLLLEEIKEGGIAKFMQRLCGSMSMTFNAKYTEKGSLFQGSYKSKTVDNDPYIQYLIYYIQVKNVLELYPGGLPQAIQNFDDAWSWALQYPFSSLSSYATERDSPIIDKSRFFEIMDARLSKEEAREMLLLHMQHNDEKYSEIALEPW